MNINKNNYEAFFLDYHEGNLSPQQVADLFLFLSQHPELKKQFEDFEHIVLEDFPSPVFKNKEDLKKNITVANREDYFIRAVENTLNPSELALLNQFLKAHPEFLPEFNLFRKTKLEADAAVVFEDKLNLKQLTATDDYVISALEGILSTEEQVFFKHKLASDAELQKSASLYQQTKSVADPAVVYPYKQFLKRKEKKIIPLYYYVAVAASLTLLIGMFFLWQTNVITKEQPVAEQILKPVQNKPKPFVQEQPALFVQSPNRQKKEITSSSVSPAVAYVKNKKTIVKKYSEQTPSSTKSKIETISQPTIETVPLNDNRIAALNPAQEKQTDFNPIDSNKLVQSKNTPLAIAKIEKKPEAITTPDYSSLRDIVANKLKEKLIGKDETKAEQNHKKLNGWDIAGFFAKGLSKVTGKKIEVKPQFNSEGNVTAYALSAGKLEFSRVK